MKTVGRFWLPVLFLVFFVGPAHAESQPSKWLRLDADSKERLRSLIQSDVESRKGFTTNEEAEINTSTVEEERQKESSAYKAAIDAANGEFQRTKKRLDDLTAQFQTASYDYEESKKNADTIKAGIENIDNSIARYQEDINGQRDALTKWLKTTKQGEAIVAVIYTRGFMDSAHELENIADQASAPLMAQHMGTYIQSFTKVINNVLTGDFIRAVEEGSAKWNREEPLRISLAQGSQGTTYLRIKRYELYPFQAPDEEKVKPGKGLRETSASIITSKQGLESFLSQNRYDAGKLDLSRVEAMIRETAQANQQAEANQREQLISFRERISYLEQKIAGARTDKESLAAILKDKQDQLGKMTTELELLRLKKESAELAFQNAQAALLEKKRVHESIIVKTSLVTVKRSETPAEAAAEAVLEELKDVLNDARMQHYTSTTDVVNGKLVDESQRQAITEAKIIAVRSLAFINEGDSIRVKMAFRVRTVLDAKAEAAKAESFPAKPVPAVEAPVAAKQKSAPAPVAKAERPAPAAKAERPAPAAKTESPLAAVEKKSTPPPVTDFAPPPAAKAMGFVFKLDKVARSGNELTFLVAATNKAEYTQYLAFYDESTGYTRSTVTPHGGAQREVDQVYLWQGSQKTPACDAYRGIAVDPNKSVTVELIFKGAVSNASTVSVLNLIPSVGTRSVIRTYSWSSQEVPFRNISIP